MFGPLVAAYIQYSIFKMLPPFWLLAPPSGFWPPLLLNPGDGPGRRPINVDGIYANVTLFSSRKILLFWNVCDWLQIICILT